MMAPDIMKARERQRRYRERHREAIQAKSREYQRQRPAADKAEATRRHRVLLREQVFGHYGWACACCGSNDQLTIDHIAGDGTAHRLELFGRPNIPSHEFYRWLIKHGFPPGYQVLCGPCNSSKRDGDHCQLWHGDPAYKRCLVCGQVKKVEKFFRRSASRDGRFHHCKICWKNRLARKEQDR